MNSNATNIYKTEQAGLVLLEPFIPQLLRHLDLYDGRNFVNDEAQHSALCLLRSIKSLSGSDALVNLFCGKEISYEQDFIQPDTESIKELHQMLEAAIQNWAVLRNITHKSFVKHWINRIGTLREHKEFWQLIVKPETGDILLDHLKWPLGVINYPWLKKAIHVEWNY